jgi:hypothetical protein
MTAPPPTTTTMMMMTIQFNSLFIYVLSSTAGGQLQSQHEYKTSTAIRQIQGRNKQKNKVKLDQFRLFTL